MGSAGGTENQASGRSALSGLFVDGRAARELAKVFLGDENARSKGSAREGLAISAMTDPNAFRIDLGLKTNRAAMTTPIN